MVFLVDAVAGNIIAADVFVWRLSLFLLMHVMMAGEQKQGWK